MNSKGVRLAKLDKIAAGGRMGDFSSLGVAGAHRGGQMGQKDTEEVLNRVKCGQMGKSVPLVPVSVCVWMLCTQGKE